MKKKSILYILLFVLSFFVLSSNVYAKADMTVGECHYVQAFGNNSKFKTLDVKVLFDSYKEEYSVEVNTKDKIKNLTPTSDQATHLKEQCYNYAVVFDPDGTNNQVRFTDDMNTASNMTAASENIQGKNINVYKFILEASYQGSELDCWYNFDFYNYDSNNSSQSYRTGVFVNMRYPKFGSSLKFSTLYFTGYNGLKFNPFKSNGDEVTWFVKKNASDGITPIYYLSSGGSETFLVNSGSSNDYYLSLLKSFRSGKCPTINYVLESIGSDHYIMLTDSNYGDMYTATPLKSYRITHDDIKNDIDLEKTTEFKLQPESQQQQSQQQQQSNPTIVCGEYNGYTSLYNKKEEYFSFNFIIKKENGVKKACIQIDNMVCTDVDPDESYIVIQQNANVMRVDQWINFIVDEDLTKHIKDTNMDTNYTCTKIINYKFAGERNYLISIKKDDQTEALNYGINSNPGGIDVTPQYPEGYTPSDDPDFHITGGDPVELTCEGILGNDFIKFMKKILGWIQIIAPILVIILGGVDFASAIISDDQDHMKKAVGKFTKRLIVAVIIFFVPFLIEFMLDIFNQAVEERGGTGNASTCLTK